MLLYQTNPVQTKAIHCLTRCDLLAAARKQGQEKPQGFTLPILHLLAKRPAG